MLFNKAEGIFLLGIPIFLVGTVCLIAVEVCNVYPARQEQAFQAINCTIVDGNMEAKEKCSNSENGESYPCLRIHVACGKKLKSDGKLQRKTRRLLSKVFHSLQQQVCTQMNENFARKSLIPSRQFSLADQVAIFFPPQGGVSFSRFILQISNAVAKTKKLKCRLHLTRD